MPGVSDTVAQVIAAEVGLDMSRFPRAGHLISWAGLCPKMDESAGKRRSTARRGAKKAILAVAASMLTAAYHMLRGDVPYRDLDGDHFDQRDKRRTANRLIKRLGALGYTVEIKAAA
jgi:transposase